MKTIFLLALATGLISCTREEAPVAEASRKDSVVDTYFGTQVADPYRWLEDDRSPETAAWVEAQNKMTRAYLDAIPEREAIKKRLTELANVPRYGLPTAIGGKTYYWKNDGLQNQSVLYVEENDKTDVVLDPNTLSADGSTSVSVFSPSRDGKYIGYGISVGGSDWNTFYVLDAQNRQPLSDKLEWVKFSGFTWFQDGFFYTRYPKPEGSALSTANENSAVYYHKIGTSQESDILVHADTQNPKVMWSVDITFDGKWLWLYSSEGTSGNAVWIRKIDSQKPFEGNWQQLVADRENNSQILTSQDGALYLVTDIDAPNQRLVKIDPAKLDRKDWVDVIPNRSERLESISFIGGKLIASYLKDVASQVEVFDITGMLEGKMELPSSGSVSGFSGWEDSTTCYYSFSSWAQPATIYSYSTETLASTLYKKPKLACDPSTLEVTQVFYPSKDDTKIPMSIVYKKGTKLNGKNPTLLYGYGGFDISITPSFSALRMALLERGCVFAVANLRGGGEYGDAWHKAGMLLNKQNVFDDFIAAAEYLIKEGYTSSQHLCINGGSNGGLLVGACMTQRPDLFAAAIPEVGVLDMLRYQNFTIGRGWAVEYGTSEDETHFNNLITYSPVHNIKAGVDYPATLVMTGDHDDRVVPAHSFKFAATLQELGAHKRPELIRIQTQAGHGAGKSMATTIEEAADKYAFILKNTGGL